MPNKPTSDLSGNKNCLFMIKHPVKIEKSGAIIPMRIVDNLP